MRYFYGWTPLVVVATVVLLTLPWLALIALAVVALVVLPALAFAVVVAPYMLGRAISRRWHGESAVPQPSSAVAATPHQRVLREEYAS